MDEMVGVKVPKEWVEKWEAQVERGEFKDKSEAIRHEIRRENYDSSKFRVRCDRFATIAGVVGIAMMGMALFMPLVFRLVALAPIGISLALYAAGYVHDSRNGVTEAHA